MANGVIANNQGRKYKSLWTDNDDGELVKYTLFESDLEEADRITSEIKRTVENSDASYNDFAILYRTMLNPEYLKKNLSLEIYLIKIIGSVNFYARRKLRIFLPILKP